jgi:hypothetical protein
VLLWHSKGCLQTFGKKGESQEWYECKQRALACELSVHASQSDPRMIKEIVEAVTIPVMAKVRIGHFVEAQVGTYAFVFGTCIELQ